MKHTKSGQILVITDQKKKKTGRKGDRKDKGRGAPAQHRTEFRVNDVKKYDSRQ